ncbi:MAG: LlaJI family restriction endonuclease [Clostridia bacterium]|nr:LlaJI family restriction endonuclease [Clostridia bacterium]
MAKESSAKLNTKHAESLVPCFIKEQKRYERDEVVKMLSGKTGNPSKDEKRAVDCIKKLKEYGILKAVRPHADSYNDISELNADEFVICDAEDAASKYQYVFTFVGVIVAEGHVLKCCPKYITKDEPSSELAEAVKVIEKYASNKKEDLNLYTSSSVAGAFNLLAVLLYLLSDYYEFGVYTNAEKILESNGTGEIHWDKTVNETFTLVHKGRPYYPDLRTIKTVNDEYDYFKRLHECVLTAASKELESCGLLEIFGMPEVDLSEETLDDFGERDQVLYNIDKELGQQFNSRKQSLLKVIYSYVARGKSLNDTDGFSLYGTASFNLVWQDVCSTIFDNKLCSTLRQLGFPSHGDFRQCDKLVNCIEKPYWSGAESFATETLEPDIVYVGGGRFIVMDAKYYTPAIEVGKELSGQPGIESVTKQYLYQLAFRKFTDEYNLKVGNCFLIPTDGDNVEDKGDVSLKILTGLGLETIKVRYLPARECYRLYLRGKKMDIGRLNL